VTTKRRRPWVLTVRIEPSAIDDVREAYADHFGEPLRNATREAIQDWIRMMVGADIETAANDIPDEEQDDDE
jgi:hypothetical protein